MDYYDDVQFTGGDEQPNCVLDVQYQPTNEHGINYLRHGEIFFSCNRERRRILKAPTVFWTIAGNHYEYGNVPGKPWHQTWVTAKGSRIDRMLGSGLIPSPPNCSFSLNERSVFDTLFPALVEAVISGTGESHPARVLLLEQLLAELYNQRIKGRVEDKLSSGIRMLARRIVENPTLKIDFRSEARRLGVSYDHYRRRFRDLQGDAPNNYRISCIIFRASQLLEKSDSSITEIANQMGFEDIYYFSRLFKSRTGLAPSKYAQSRQFE